VPPWWLVGVAVVLHVLTTLDVAHHGVLIDLDNAVSRRMIDWDLRHNYVGRPLALALTLFGQRGLVLLITVPVIAYLTWRTRTSEFALRYLLALVLLTIVVYALKGTVTRPAPIPGPHDGRDSYPSGHLPNAILVWGIVAWSAARAGAPAAVTRALRIVRTVGPGAVIVGMTLLNFHWISDFIGGACIGIALLPVVTLPIWADVAAGLDRRLPRRAHVP
jgi:membrane-associated phospholipid phosphatase